MIRIERVRKSWPDVPPTPEQRGRVYAGVIKHVVPEGELALRRKHGKAIQARLFAAKQYEREAIATAHVVTQEDYENANS